MANNEETTHFEVDYDIDSDREIPGMEQCNDFESFEVEIPDDINICDLEELEEDDEYPLPKIQFVSESKVCQVVVVAVSEESVFEELICGKCGKRYKKKNFYEKHILICGINNKPVKDVVVSGSVKPTVKQKKSNKKDNILVRDEEIIALSSSLVESAIKSVVNNAIYKIKVKDVITPGNKVILLAEKLLSEMTEAENKIRAISLTTSLVDFIKGNQIMKVSGREILWTNVHKFIQDETVQTEWAHVLGISLPSREFNMLFRNIVMKLIQLVIQHENEHRYTKKSLTIHLTTEEQQVVSYVAGFIIFSLKQKYKRILALDNKNKDIATATLQFLETLISSDKYGNNTSSFLEFTKGWINLVNRGGLVVVNDDMFVFCRRIENSVRTVLNNNLIKTYRGEDIRDVIEKGLEKEGLVNLAWETISRKLVNRDLAKILMKQIIRKWVDLRARAYVSAYIQVVKRKLANLSKDKVKNAILSKKGEPAMRKKLT